MNLFTRAAAAAAAASVCAGCAVLEPYKAPGTSFHIASVKREDKLLAIDGQSRLVAAKGIDSQSTRNTAKTSHCPEVLRSLTCRPHSLVRLPVVTP